MKRHDYNVPEDLWAVVAPLMPVEEAKAQGGRPRVPNYRIFGGVLYRLRTGCQWEAVPRRFGTSSTLQRRFQQCEVHWTGEDYAPCTGKGGEHCAAGNRAFLRVAFNAYQMNDGAVKIMEGGAEWFTDIVKVRDKYGLKNWSFEIERHGAAGDPKTTYSILPDAKLDDAQKRAIAAASLHDLAGQDGVGAKSAPEGAAATTTTSAPVAARAPQAYRHRTPAREIYQQLSRMPKAEVDALMARFGITKLTELKGKNEDAAREFVYERNKAMFFSV